MPCCDGGPSLSDWESQRERADDLARKLCRLCKTLEDKDLKDLICEHTDVHVWWIEHKQEDARRLVAEAEVARKAKIRRDALAKLTPEEIAVLKPWGAL